MHDGQNVFDAATAFVQQEWQADEAALDSARAGRPVIVVAVSAIDMQPRGGGRLSEYGPFPMPEMGAEGLGPRYAAFLADTLKPLVDARYRTLPDREHTGLAGASMGGLISLYAALERPEVYGFAGVFSPSLWPARGAVIPWVEARPRGPAVRVWLDLGDREGDTLDQAAAGVESARRLAELLRLRGHAVRFEVAPGARHTENAWARRFPRALQLFLAGP
jgi:predicted alpha/beta superfamily hydrolase